MASRPLFYNVIKCIVKCYSLNICCFHETRISGESIPIAHRALGVSWKMYAITAEGLFGGIIIIWRNNLGDTDFCLFSASYFLVVSLPNCPSWILGTIYARTKAVHWRMLWQMDSKLIDIGMPTLLIGDFNYIVFIFEKHGGKELVVNHDVREFQLSIIPI